MHREYIKCLYDKNVCKFNINFSLAMKLLVIIQLIKF